MRRSLAGVALAVTLMVALSFLLPLGVLVRTEARGQHIAAAEQRAAALAPVLALTTDTDQLTAAISSLDPDDGLGVRLPDGQQLGSDHSPAQLLARAAAQRESLTEDIPGGWLYLQPVVLPQGRVAVIEEYLPAGQLTDGVATSWGVMTLLTVCLVLGSMFVADRLGAQVVRSSRRLSRAAHQIGSGDLDSRVDPSGPPELQRVGAAFNAMADRVVELLAVERELVADLSHRLRTPLTALHLAAERMGPTPDAQRVTAAIDQLESELQAIIAAARTPLATGPMGRALQASEGRPGEASGRTKEAQGGGSRLGSAGRDRDEAPVCEAADVVERRAGFWATLAEHQGRPCEVRVSSEPTPVNLSADDLGAVVDALVGNVFRHTPAGTAFTVDVTRTALAVQLTLEDAGPGIADPESALARGSSDSSTGLGLDIALRAAIATRGNLRITRADLGGARITLTLGLASATPPRGRARALASGRLSRRAAR
ncbi:sensor histidine kinase [Streptacidiphilus melanogenes]|uniref:sensor histidine kinase n=1 Tax=Streptacidiphilus melanogenes TaxID=411235 RepID=UPI0005A8504A|nr:HAMP domain-containing sensor histidine kinase [Streptacidiphilus melanogenes]